MDDERPDDLGIEVKSDEESDSGGDLVPMVIEKPKEKWDCESILSMLERKIKSSCLLICVIWKITLNHVLFLLQVHIQIFITTLS